MIKIEKVQLFGFEPAIRGMRNPMNSWGKSDSDFETLKIGEKDISLMKRLCKAGIDHRKFMRMLTVSLDITAPLYWWKEFDTYKIGTVANSCSTMHKIHEKELLPSDFSFEYANVNDFAPLITRLNELRESYNETKEKKYWYALIQMLPCAYNQKRTVMLNYEVLLNMYSARKKHKLNEWKEFCLWISQLSLMDEFTEGERING